MSSRRVTDTLGLPASAIQSFRRRMLAIARAFLSDEAHVEDAVNDAFLEACKKEKSDRPDEKNQNLYRNWLCGILRHILLDHVRYKRDVEPMEDALALADPRDDAWIVEVQAPLVEAYLSLSEYEQDLIERHVLEEISIKDIADEEGANYTTVYSAYFRAMGRLRALLDAADKARGGHPTALFPFFLLLLIAREARASVRAAGKRMASMRFFASVAAGAALFAVMPSPPQAMGGANTAFEAQIAEEPETTWQSFTSRPVPEQPKREPREMVGAESPRPSRSAIDMTAAAVRRRGNRGAVK